MKVKELITQLQKFDPESEVWIESFKKDLATKDFDLTNYESSCDLHIGPK